MRLPKSFTTVTPLSKTLALIIFVSVPFIGFYYGQKLKVCDICPAVKLSSVNQIKPSPSPTMAISPGEVTITDNKNNHWGTYSNDRGIKFNFPPNFEIGITLTTNDNLDYFGISSPPKEEMMPGTGYNFYISLNPNQNNLLEYVSSEYSLIKTQHANDPRFNIINEKTVKYGNNTAYRFTVEGSQSPPTDEIYFFNNGVGLHISETGISLAEHLRVMNSVVFTKI